jgi:Tfp pilus assembly protein PilN
MAAVERQHALVVLLARLLMVVASVGEGVTVMRALLNLGARRERRGGQELLEAIASTVSRTDTLWLTSVERKGDGLTINGSAGSLNAVANYITQLKRSGYFQTVEIKESHQDNSDKAVQIFVFTLTTQFGLPQSGGAAPASTGTAAPAANTPPAARKPGNT